MNGERELPLFLTSILMVKRLVAIGANQGLPQVSLSRMMRTTITSTETEIYLRKAWEMMLWVEHSTKFPDHLPHPKLSEGDFLDSSFSQRSPFTMVKRTLWSMLAISIKEWPCTPRTKPWCARYSYLVWDLWRWNGMMVWVQVPLVPTRNSLRHLDPASSRAAGFLNP